MSALRYRDKWRLANEPEEPERRRRTMAENLQMLRDCLKELAAKQVAGFRPLACPFCREPIFQRFAGHRGEFHAFHACPKDGMEHWGKSADSEEAQRMILTTFSI